MANLTFSVHFDTPPEQAFEFIAHRYFLNVQQWDPTILDARQLTAGLVGPRSQGVLREKVGGRVSEKAYQVSRWEQDRLFELLGMPSQRVQGEIVRRQYRMQRENGGTRLECEVEYEPITRTFSFARPRNRPPRRVTREVEQVAVLLKRAIERSMVPTIPAS